MDRLTLEEMQQRLANVPIEEFGCDHQTCAIGQLNLVLTGERSFGFDGNVYPEDVAMVVAEWNDALFPVDRKSLAMMLPLPESFPVLTKERTRKLALWAGEKALSHYTGSKRKILECAVDLAKRASAGEAYTAEEATAVSVAVDEIRHHATKIQLLRVASVVLNMVKTLLTGVMQDESWSITAGEAVCDMARVVRHAGADWREWMQEYLRIRLEA